MDDLISRQATLKAIKNCESGESFEYNEGLIAAMNAVVDMPSAQEWIPITKRLPERRKWVLCQCCGGIVEVMRWENNEWYHDTHHVYFSDFVTHWMPLPEPPKSEMLKIDGYNFMEGKE